MTASIRYFLLSLLAITFSFSTASAEEEKVMIVLDVSGSMWGQIDGVAKIQIARSALKSMVSKWPDNREVGLVAYGHRSKGDCGDIETVVPIGPLDKAKLGKVVDKLVPRGKTPLSAAVKHAAEELKYTENKATVILISDGIETCDLDPCKIGTELEELGIDFTAHVIGFDVNSVEDQKGLKCLAENTGGKFLAAANANQLNEALTEATKAVAAPEPVVEKKLPPKAEITAPESAIKSTEITFQITGEEGIEGWVHIFAKGKDKSLGYSGVYSDDNGGYKPGQIRLPATVGEYELKLKTDDNVVIAQTIVKAIDAEITIEAPAEAPIGTELSFTPHGPEGLDGYVHLYAAGKDKSITYDRVWPTDNGEGYKKGAIRLPTTTGEYTLKWLSLGEEVLAESKLKVIDSEISLEAPVEAAIGTEIAFTPHGPEGLDGYVHLYAAGKDKSITYDRVWPVDNGEGYKKGTIRVPATTGEYTLKWRSLLNEEVMAEAQLKVVAAEIRLEIPTEVPAGTEVFFTPHGPEGLDGYVHLYAAGKDKSITEERVWSADIGGYKKGSIRVPAKVGEYTLKWKSLLNDQTLVETKLKIVAAEISLEAPAEAPIGTEISFTPHGPEGLDGRIHLYAAGKDKSITEERVWPGEIDGYKTGTIQVPAKAGEYTLKWLSLLNSEVLTERKIKVIPAEIKLEAQDQAPVKTELSFTASGPEGLAGRVYLYAAGKDKSLAEERVWPADTGGYKTGTIRLPAIAGEYTLKWQSLLNKEVLAEKAITVITE